MTGYLRLVQISFVPAEGKSDKQDVYKSLETKISLLQNLQRFRQIYKAEIVSSFGKKEDCLYRASGRKIVLDTRHQQYFLA